MGVETFLTVAFWMYGIALFIRLKYICVNDHFLFKPWISV